MKKIASILMFLVLLLACKEETPLTFSEEIITSENEAEIEIVYSKLDGNSQVAKTINTYIESEIAKSLDTDDNAKSSLNEAIKNFNKNYTDFKTQFPESNLKWEALVDSEVIYNNPELLSVGLNTYLNTGGAHGNSYIQFLNFNPENGKVFEKKDLINENEAFVELVKQHFIQNLDDEDRNQNLDDYFFEGSFKLPEQIGFNDDGIIILYNTYEIASYAQGITEFTIPFDEIKEFLKF